MNGSIGFAIALTAGLLSFLSPCVLPLVPSYLSFVTGMNLDELQESADRRAHVITHALLFVAGFTLVFTILGVSAGVAGSVLLRNRSSLIQVFGVVIIALGLVTAGLLRVPALQRERRMDLAKVPRGPAWAFPMGMAFAFGWVPCIGPVLATILATASASGTAWWGGVLLAL